MVNRETFLRSVSQTVSDSIFSLLRVKIIVIRFSKPMVLVVNMDNVYVVMISLFGIRYLMFGFFVIRFSMCVIRYSIFVVRKTHIDNRTLKITPNEYLPHSRPKAPLEIRFLLFHKQFLINTESLRLTFYPMLPIILHGLKPCEHQCQTLLKS